MIEAYHRTAGQTLSARLLAALAKAAELKGDARGLESAAVLSVPRQTQDWRSQIVNLRADDSADPVAELVRLYSLFERRFGAQ